MDVLARLVEVAAWWDAIRRVTGDSFYPALALLILVLMIVGAWRAPQLPWFTGRVALGVIVVLVLLLAVVVGAEVVSRESQDTVKPAQEGHRKPIPGHVPTQVPEPPAG